MLRITRMIQLESPTDAVFSTKRANSLFGPSAAKFASRTPGPSHISRFSSFPPFFSFSPYTTGDTITTTLTIIQQMHIERNKANILSLLGPNQMRTEINLQKLFRNYRSQIRVDAERRRGAP
jgi:hypothetical protein